MTFWTEAAEVASVIEAAVVAISLLVVAYQVRKQTLLARAANTHNLFQVSSDLNLQLIQDPKLAETWLKAIRGRGNEPVEASEIDAFRRRDLLMWWLMLHENIYHQWQAGLLDAGVYAAWQADLRRFIGYPGVTAELKKSAEVLSSDFVCHVQKLTAAQTGDTLSEPLKGKSP